jgi:coenzyme F420-0:L-glutamate ligase/coenzyme F420-1:gamma-L-glutamate ligase
VIEKLNIQETKVGSKSRDRMEPPARQSTGLPLIGLEGLPLVRPGDDLGVLIADSLSRQGIQLVDGDVLAVAQKVVSKAEGRYVSLRDVTPSEPAEKLACETEKDPRLVEVILSESKEVLRYRSNLIVTAHRHGFVMANAGVDQSNVEQDGGETVLLLPKDADESAEALRAQLSRNSDCKLAVIVPDSFGRAWRRGTVGVALGAAGLPSLLDMRGHPDLFGRSLRVTEVAFADEIAAAASLIMGQSNERIPVVIIRGLSWSSASSPATALLRSPAEDLFR